MAESASPSKTAGRKPVRLVWRLFSSLGIVVILILSMIWVFMTLFIDDLYQAVKGYRIRLTSQFLVSQLDRSDLADFLRHFAADNELSIRVYTRDGNEISSAGFYRQTPFTGWDVTRIRQYYEETAAQGGVAIHIEKFKLAQPASDEIDEARAQPSEGHFDALRTSGRPPETLSDRPLNPNRDPERRAYDLHARATSMLFLRIAPRQTDEQVLIAVHALVTPVSGTKSVLKAILGLITPIILLSSLIVAWYLSRRIARPIERLTRAAYNLTRADRDAYFNSRDFAEIAVLSDTLNTTARELLQVDRMRRELIANVSHDLRTPLTMITGYAEMMRDFPAEHSPANAQHIINEAQRLTSLVNEMLDLSKLQARTLPLNEETYDIDRQLREIVSHYAGLCVADKPCVIYRSNRPQWVRADALKISQVLHNLILNACQASPEQKPVEVALLVRDSVVRLEVRDRGSGIPPEELARIWQRYYRLRPNADENKPSSTGLGLPISRQILELHQANYGVQSELGEGSTFWFELPAAPAP